MAENTSKTAIIFPVISDFEHVASTHIFNFHTHHKSVNENPTFSRHFLQFARAHTIHKCNTIFLGNHLRGVGGSGTFPAPRRKYFLTVTDRSLEIIDSFLSLALPLMAAQLYFQGQVRCGCFAFYSAPLHSWLRLQRQPKHVDEVAQVVQSSGMGATFRWFHAVALNKAGRRLSALNNQAALKKLPLPARRH
jgi:hypothetical protein